MIDDLIFDHKMTQASKHQEKTDKQSIECIGVAKKIKDLIDYRKTQIMFQR